MQTPPHVIMKPANDLKCYRGDDLIVLSGSCGLYHREIHKLCIISFRNILLILKKKILKLHQKGHWE